MVIRAMVEYTACLATDVTQDITAMGRMVFHQIISTMADGTTAMKADQFHIFIASTNNYNEGTFVLY